MLVFVFYSEYLFFIFPACGVKTVNKSSSASSSFIPSRITSPFPGNNALILPVALPGNQLGTGKRHRQDKQPPPVPTLIVFTINTFISLSEHFKGETGRLIFPKNKSFVRNLEIWVRRCILRYNCYIYIYFVCFLNWALKLQICMGRFLWYICTDAKMKTEP